MIFIDRDLCTGCRRCLDVCPTGAIMEARSEVTVITPSSSTDVPAQPAEVSGDWVKKPPLRWAGRDAAAVAAAASRPSALAPGAPAVSSGGPGALWPAVARTAPSRLDGVQRLVSGLLSFAAFVLDRGQGARGGGQGRAERYRAGRRKKRS